MGKGYRAGRLGEEIRKIISELLLREIKDPRLTNNLVSVASVSVTEDGSYATVFVTALGHSAKEETTKEEKEEVLTALNSAKGLIRREIGKQIKVRHVPELSFKFDTSQEYGRHIEKIIDELGIEQAEETKEQDEE